MFDIKENTSQMPLKIISFEVKKNIKTHGKIRYLITFVTSLITSKIRLYE
jgi:hypothetical protein